MNRGGGARIQTRLDVGDGPAMARFALQRIPRDVVKRLGKRMRHNGEVSRLRFRPYLRQHLDQQYTERPDVAGGSERLIYGFRGVVGGALRSRLVNFTGGKEAVGGKLDLIAGGQNVGRLEA